MNVYILVVDDEPDVEALFRQQFRRDLRAGRFQMEFAPSASDALRLASEVRDPSLILILSDINMPGMSGLDMLEELQQRGSVLPAIVMTGHTDEGSARRLGSLRPLGLLEKPFSVAQLKQMLRRAAEQGG